MLWTKNKILEATVHIPERQNLSVERQLCTHLEESSEKDQYGRRQCLEIRGIPFPETPADENTDDVVKQVGKLVDVNISDQDISVKSYTKIYGAD